MTEPWPKFEPRPRRRGWDAAWRVALLVLAALAAGWILDALLDLL